MQQIFNEIMNKLKQTPSLNYCAEDWGQLNFEQPPLNFPCALIDLGSAEFSQASNRVQLGEGVINITIADVNQSVVQNMPQAMQNNSFRIFDIIDEINAQLHGFEGDNFGKLTRISVSKVIREDLIREFVINYRFTFKDASAQPVRQKLSDVTPQIST